MKLFKRLTALCLALVLTCGLLPVPSMAAEQEEIDLQFTYINPCYSDIITEADIPEPSLKRIQTYASEEYVTIEEAGLLLRPYLTQREETVAVKVKTAQADEAYLKEVMEEIFNIAIAHTGVPTEGDYLRWQYGSLSCQIGGSYADGTYNLTYTYTFDYYTTAAEEQQVDAAVEELLSGLNLSGKSDYEKIKAVYDYICANVRYDHEHLGNEDYKYQFTAHAALFDGTAVCQGYSVLLYRLALELGIDCRFIAGLGNGGAHGWNIVELDNLYYNADATWDEGQSSYSWFLKCPDNFSKHVRNEEYDTSAFHSAYPMASADYVPHTHSYSTTVTAPTCTEKGYTTYSCSCGNSYVADYVNATGHSFGSWYQTQAPTEEAPGEERRDCANCDHYETQEIPKLEPSNPSGTCGENLTWVFDEKTGTLTISGTGEMDTIEFDSTNGYPLQPWKDWNDQIKSVTIQSGATNIVNYAFSHCENLETVMIPSTVTELSVGAFQSCPGLKEIQVDDGNQNYRTMDGVLYTKDTTTLVKYPAARTGTTYTVPDTVTVLTPQAFEYAATLVSITLPDNISVLGIDTFADCTSLKNIRLPKNLTDMEASCIFWNCSSLESIEIPDNVQVIGASVFAYCSNLKQVTLSAGLKKIGGHAFGRCENLATITIPAGVNYLEYKIFEGSGLQSVTFDGDTPNFHEETFTNITATAYYPANNPTWTSDVMQDYGGDITWVAYGHEPATSGTCGDNLTWNFNATTGQLTVSGSGDMYGADKLGWTAFADDIRSVEIGNGATSVGAYAFADCTNLNAVQMPDTVMSIAYNAFEHCSRLKTVDIPEKVMEISYGAFMDCTSLASVELPQNVMSISYHAFDNCTSLSEVEFPTSLASIQDEAFGSCTGLDEMHFTGNAPEIQSKAFSKVTADAYYPADNTTWTSDVLQNYGGTLTWIAEGGSVEPDNSCGENITWEFEASTGTLTISGTNAKARSNGISIMDDYARPEDTPWYQYQDQIITVVIESTVDSIGKNAFAGCSNLTTVIIEEGVSEIHSTAFSDCEALENCYFEGTEEQWESLGAEIGETTVHTESAEPETHVETKKTVAPTCTEQGYDLYTCSCGTTRKDNFTKPTGHSYTAVVTKPTCTEKGYTTYTCSCGDTYTGDEVAALDHDWDEGTVTREPSAEAPGIRTFHCERCEETKTEEIPYEAPVVTGSVSRISGKDRVKTALSVAKALKDALNADKFDAVIIATGINEKFADALAGSYLANVKGAPILLYTGSGLSQLNVDFIEENLKSGGTVYILGGTGAIPATVEDALPDNAYTVKRLYGKTRYETNLAILKEAGVSGADEILVATGTNFADSLSASAVGLPLLLVNGKGTSLTDAQIEFLKSVPGKKITILGGTGAVSEEMEAAIESVTGVEAQRISGKSRQNTSVKIAEKYFGTPEKALLTYAWNFPDGLAGGPLAYALGAPLLLTSAGSEDVANEYIAAKNIENGYVLGGDAAVSDETAQKVFGLSADTVISKAYYTQ